MLINAAGILRMGATDQPSKEDWQQTFSVNVCSVFILFPTHIEESPPQPGAAAVLL
ncbi:2,3-dihydro-2,3-dihydroxybenzoate dehydrogenase [Escherichia coli]|nr:2,3-dihydro-2,3-dihydroxybenzoate dehydrogenase [Escherichia coli]